MCHKHFIVTTGVRLVLPVVVYFRQFFTNHFSISIIISLLIDWWFLENLDLNWDNYSNNYWKNGYLWAFGRWWKSSTTRNKCFIFAYTFPSLGCAAWAHTERILDYVNTTSSSISHIFILVLLWSAITVIWSNHITITFTLDIFLFLRNADVWHVNCLGV